MKEKILDPTLHIMIKRCVSATESGWLTMRETLWSNCTREQHLSEIQRWCADQNRLAAFLAYADTERPIGFAEASIRSDYVNGTETSPVGFLEGLYVHPQFRLKGVARELVAAVERWAASTGCLELASDADIQNKASQKMHQALGFEETERVVYFKKWLGNLSHSKSASTDTEK